METTKTIRRGGTQTLVSLGELLEVRESPTTGVGTFLKQAVPEWFILGEVHGQFITDPDYTSLTCCDAAVEGAIIEPDDSGVPVHRMNHACVPNCMLDSDDDNPAVLLVLTTRPIAAGEELTIDYGWPLSTHPPIPCRCGHPECRGWVIDAEDAPRLIAPTLWTPHWDEAIFLGRSLTSGVGLFARMNIPRERAVGEVIGEFWSHGYSTQTCLAVGDKYVHPTAGVPVWMLNHSCDPNVDVALFYYGGAYHMFLQTVDDVEVGEELGLNYEEFKPTPCLCPSCRRAR